MRALPLLGVALFVAAPAFSQCPNDDGRFNNWFTTASSLPPGANSLTGVVFGSGSTNPNDPGNDFFSFDLGPGATARFELSMPGTAPYLQVYTPSAGGLGGSNPGQGFITYDFTNPGTSVASYVLRVASAVDNGCREYTLVSRVDVCPGDDWLENFDTCQSSFALPLTAPLQIDRLAVLDVDDDWFDVRLMPGEQLEVEILFSHAIADIDLRLLDLNGGNCGGPNLATSASVTDNERVTYLNAGATYQDIGIGVEWYSTTNGASCNDYQLVYSITSVPDDPYEDNDDICTPAPLDLGVVRDLIVRRGDPDFYSFLVSPGERLRAVIDFIDADGDLDVRLWDVSGGCSNPVLVDGSYSLSNREEVEFVGSAPGATAVVLEVFYYPSDGGDNIYDLTIGFSRSTDLGDLVCVGEPNSRGLQSYLYGAGSLAVPDDDFFLQCQDLPFNQFGIFVASRGYNFLPNPAGSLGNLCVGPALGRLVGPGQIQSSGSNGFVSLQLDLSALPQGAGSVPALPGEVWFFQRWYRDVSGGSAVSNFSSALRVEFE